MSAMDPDVSVVLVTYNGARWLDEVLSAVRAQRTRQRFEIVAVDSSSTDATRAILERHGARVHVIPKAEFGHGRTRNLGGRLARGRYLVFMTQDATPADESWLEQLVAPLLADPTVAGSYSRQVARPGCNAVERRDIEAGAGTERLVKQVDFSDPREAARFARERRRLILFSNVSSCIRREALERIPFDEGLSIMEDQDWCRRALEAGWKVVYEPSSAVLHSHDFPLREVFRRHRDYGLAYGAIAQFRLSLPRVLFYTLVESSRDALYALRCDAPALWKLRGALAAPALRFAMRYGLHRGIRAAERARAR